MRDVLCSIIALTLLPIVAGAQETSHPKGSSTPSGRTQAWVGCWVLQAISDEKVTRSDTVRLNGSVLPKRTGRTWYQGLRVPAQPQHYSGSVSWSMSQQGDSAEIRVEALGGTIWRVARHTDSLTGETYSTFDIVPGEHHFGPATGRRLEC
jgi:hypothetical protein